MAFDMLEAMTMIAREKNIELEAVIETLEESLLAAAKKKYANTDNISFKFDRKTNELLMMATKRVTNEVNESDVEISIEEAREIDSSADLGDEVDIYIDYEAEFGRNAIASAKQILVQKVREKERDRIYDEYIDKIGTLIAGVVQQVDKGNVIVNLGRGESLLPIKEQIPREKFRQGDRVRALIIDVQKASRGPQIILSRVNNEFVRALFALEVPEIFEKIIEIRTIAREPGERTKVAVYSSDERIDPVGACVGIKGVRVQSIVRELNNERIDIVPYSSNPEVFVTRALAPANVVAIELNEEEQKMTVVVEEDKLSLAIGRSGQNARLASKLTGWKVNIMSDVEYDISKHMEAELLAPVGQLEGVGPKLEERLSEANIATVQKLAESSIETLTKIEGLGQKTAETLIERSKELVEVLEEEYRKKKEAEREAQKGLSAKDKDKLSVGDVFEDDDDYVTEEDDVQKAEQPEVEADEDEDKKEKNEEKDTDDKTEEDTGEKV